MKNKIISILLSVVIALGVWVYVVTVESPNSDKTVYNIPVTVEGKDSLLNREQPLMITGVGTEKVTLHFEGSRIDLNKISSSNIKVILDVSRIYEAGTHELTYTVELPGDVPSNAIAVSNKNPGKIQVEAEQWALKDNIPVQVEDVGQLPEDFRAEMDELQYHNASEIAVEGPKYIVDTIAYAKVEVDVTGKTQNVTGAFQYTLLDQKGRPVDTSKLILTPEKVELTLPIVQVKTIDLYVEVESGGGATKDDCVMEYSLEKISVAGSQEKLAALGDSFKLGTVKLSEVAEGEVKTFPITLPDGVENESGEEEVTVTFSFPTLTTVKVKTRNIVPINIPENRKVEINAQAVTLELRGPADKLATLSEDKITVTVDVAGVDGNDMLPIRVDCGDPAIGAVNAPKVSVTVTGG